MVCLMTGKCDFIDQYVSCKIPQEDSKLKELVLSLQNHKHSSYCRRNKVCRFNFPKPPSSKTLITRDDAEPDEVVEAIDVLGKVQKFIIMAGLNAVGCKVSF